MNGLGIVALGKISSEGFTHLQMGFSYCLVSGF
jgi:hypothetical protein